MSEQDKNGAPKYFMIVSGIALLWNLMGVMAYVMQMTMTQDALAAMSEAERMLYSNQPAWATAAFAIAVNGGALGCLLLLLKKSLAVLVLIVSLLGVAIQMFYNFFIADTMAVYGPGSIIMPIAVLMFSVFLIWFSMDARNKGWLG